LEDIGIDIHKFGVVAALHVPEVGIVAANLDGATSRYGVSGFPEGHSPVPVDLGKRGRVVVAGEVLCSAHGKLFEFWGKPEICEVFNLRFEDVYVVVPAAFTVVERFAAFSVNAPVDDLERELVDRSLVGVGGIKFR